MKRKNWFRKSRKQSKPQDKPAEEYSVDEILTEFRRDYVEPEDETMEQDRPVEEPEDEGTVLWEEETQTEEIEEEKTGAPEEDVVYSVHDILRDYRLMTMESRYKEDNLEQEEKTEIELPASPAARAEAEPEPEEEPAEEPETAGRGERLSFRDFLRDRGVLTPVGHLHEFFQNIMESMGFVRFDRRLTADIFL